MDTVGRSDGPFHFVQLADTQLGMEATFQTGGLLLQRQFGWANELALLRRAVEEVNRLRPAFVIVCGDLVNEFPPEERGREGADDDVRAAQERDFKEAMGHVDVAIPLLCVCGNHDVGNRPNSQTIKRYTDSFGDDYFSFWCHGWKCIVVNSQLWKDDEDAKELRERMDKWIDTELEEEWVGLGPPRLLMFSHIAPFLFEPDERSGYFNLERCFRRELLAKMATRGVVAWFCGHYHRNAGGVYCHEGGRELEVVVTGSVGAQIVDAAEGDPIGLSGIGGCDIGEHVSGFRLVRVLEDRVEHEWRTFATCALAGLEDS